MTFTQQFFVSLTGSSFGFLSALVMLWVKSWFDESVKEKTLVKNLHTELEYNRNLLNEYMKNINYCIESVSKEHPIIFKKPDYTLIARHFSTKFYEEGLVSKRLTVDDIKNWYAYISTLSETRNIYIVEAIEKHQKEELSKKDLIRVLEDEMQFIKHAVRHSEYLDKKI